MFSYVLILIIIIIIIITTISPETEVFADKEDRGHS